MPFFELPSYVSAELLHSIEYGKTYFLPEINGIYVVRIGKTTHKQFQQLYRILLEKIAERKPEALIVDLSRGETNSLEDRAWLLMKWLPELKNVLGNQTIEIAGIVGIQTGFTKIIATYLEKAISEMSSFPVRAVYSLEEALAWLKSMDNN